MSKTVSQGFLDAWGKKYGKNGKVYVQYKRRYWNGSSYVYEDTWTNLTMRQFSVSGQINMKLDTPLLNTIKSSNVALKLKNTDYQWLAENLTTGIFKPDLVATSGYHPFLTKFRIQFGYMISDGTFELVDLFTGVAIDWIFDTSSAEVEVQVAGNDFLLQAADAQLVSDAFIDEDCIPPTGDGSITAFTTTSLGVSYINQNGGVTDDGVGQVQGTSYTLSNINVYNTPATINFVVPPIAGHAIKSSGRSWKVLQRIEDLVGLLCDQANITSSYRTISPAVFPATSQTVTLDSQSDWQAGTLSNMDSVVEPGSITLGFQLSNLGFETGDYTSWVTNSIVPGGGTAMASVQNTVKRSGNYASAMEIQASSPTQWAGGTQHCRVSLYQVGVGVINVSEISPASSWTQISINVPGSIDPTMYHLFFQLYSLDGSSHELQSTQIYTSQTVSAGSNDRIVTFWYQYKSGISVNPSLTLYVDDIEAHGFDSPGTSLSAEIDLGAAPVAWGAITSSQTLHTGTMLIQTQTATISGGPYDALADLDINNVPTSALKRYLKIKATLTSTIDGAVIDKIQLPFSSTAVTFAMANFSGMTCFSAIQKLAELCDYEWGFDGDGNLFFRGKDAIGAPIVTIDQSRSISKIVDFRPGYDAVINNGQVISGNSGEYYSEYNSSSLPESSPTSQQTFLTQIRQDSYTQFLLAFDADISAGRAQLIHDNNYRSRRRARIVGKIIPHADVSDAITVTYMERPIDKDSIFGDPLRKWPYAFGIPSNFLLKNVNFKIIGAMIDPVACSGEYEIQEVL